MYTKKLIPVIICVLLMSSHSYSQVFTAGAAGMNIRPGTIVSIDSLTLTPSAALSLTSTSLTQSPAAVSVNGNNSIDKVFTFSTPVVFSGTVGMSYTASELNGNTAPALIIAYKGAPGGVYTLNCGSIVNTANQTVKSSSLSGAALSGITAVQSTITVAAIGNSGAVCQGAARTLTDATAGGSWSSGAPAIAAVCSTGVVTGVAGGTATITYTVSNGCNTGTAVTTVTVNLLPAVAAISGTATVCAGGAHITLTDGTTGGTWSCGSTSVATAGSTGIITGVAGGNATISYTVTSSCGTARAAKTVTVSPLPAVAAISGTATVCAGAVTALADATAGGHWSSSEVAVATTGTTGRVSGVSAGTATISYAVTNTCGSSAATKVVTVNAVPAAAAISGPGTVGTGAAITLTDAASGGTWSAGNTHASVLAGAVTGVSAGTVTISYAISNTCGSSVATKAITVNVTVAAVTGTKTVCAGATTTLSDATAGGTWSSSSASIALCGASGIVTGVSAGTATITYTVSGNHITAVVTVDPLPASISGSTTVAAGAGITLTDAAAGGTWSSSSTAKATVVSTSGVVHGVAAGSATISYTLATGCSSSKSITVTAPSKGGREAGDDSTGVTTAPAEMNVSVMPNPNKGAFIIRGSLGTSGDAEVSLEVTNMLGQVIYRNKVLTQNGQINEQVQLTNIANGMYILNLSSGGQIKAFHIVVEQ